MWQSQLPLSILQKPSAGPQNRQWCKGKNSLLLGRNLEQDQPWSSTCGEADLLMISKEKVEGNGSLDRKKRRTHGRRCHPCAPVPIDKTMLVYNWLLQLNCAPPSPPCCLLPAILDSGWLRTAFASAHAKAGPVPSESLGLLQHFLCISPIRSCCTRRY